MNAVEGLRISDDEGVIVFGERETIVLGEPLQPFRDDVFVIPIIVGTTNPNGAFGRVGSEGDWEGREKFVT